MKLEPEQIEKWLAWVARFSPEDQELILKRDLTVLDLRFVHVMSTGVTHEIADRLLNGLRAKEDEIDARFGPA